MNPNGRSYSDVVSDPAYERCTAGAYKDAWRGQESVVVHHHATNTYWQTLISSWGDFDSLTPLEWFRVVPKTEIVTYYERVR